MEKIDIKISQLNVSACSPEELVKLFNEGPGRKGVYLSVNGELDGVDGCTYGFTLAAKGATEQDLLNARGKILDIVTGAQVVSPIIRAFKHKPGADDAEVLDV